MDLGVPFEVAALPPPLLEVKSETILFLLTWRTTMGVFVEDAGVTAAVAASAAFVGGVMDLGLVAAAAAVIGAPPAWGDRRTRETEPGPQGITDPAPTREVTGETTWVGLPLLGVRPLEVV